jgi:hypothetical protein
MDLDANLRDFPTLSRLMEAGAIQASPLDARRRASIMRRAPDKFSHLTRDEYIKFHTLGIPFRSGHLDGNLAAVPETVSSR